MKAWTIKYCDEASGGSAIENWLMELPDEQAELVSKLIKMVGLYGNNLRMPHSYPLGDGLFELRERKFGLRVYYGVQKNRVVILLAAGDKSSQRKDIRIARDRLEKS